MTNRLILFLITVGDFIVLWVLMHFGVDYISDSKEWNNDKDIIFKMVCTLSLAVSEYFFSTIIHRRIVGASDILQRSTMLVLTWTLLSYLSLRAIRFLARLGWQIFTMGLILLAVIILKRFIERLIVKRLRRLGYNSRSVTLVGTDLELSHLYDKLISNPSFGYRIKSYYGHIDRLTTKGSVNDFKALLSHPDDLQIGDEVYLCVPLKEHELIESTASLCNHRMSKFYYVPTTKEKLNLHPLQIDDLNVFTTYTSPLEEPLNRAVKRLFDICLSVVFLLFTILLTPFIALAIKWQSPGPVFFRQRRTGINGKEFDCYKFRSMHVNSDADLKQATKNDPRKFAFGNFMRKTNIDELPQFWNVLKGNMSIVGPRPHMLAHTEQYDRLIEKYMVRHFAKPGVTGWAQVTGFRGETRELWQMEGRVERDIWYIQHWSLWLDLRIIWLTAKTIFKRDKNAY